MSGYVDHAWRHEEEGSDPLKFTRGQNIASLRDFGAFTVPGDNANHYLSMQDGSTAVFDTTDTSIFANASSTTFTGSPVYGLQILRFGLYRVEWDFRVSTGGTAGVRLDTYWSASGSGHLSSFQFGRTAAHVDDSWDLTANGHISFAEYHSFGTGDVPSVLAPYAKVASGSSITLNVYLIVTRIVNAELNV